MENRNKTNNEGRSRLFTLFKLVIFLMFIVGLPLYVFLRFGGEIASLRSTEEALALLEDRSVDGGVIYVFFQIIQIVISWIPSNAVQFAAGYIYGTPRAYVLSLIGVALGTTIVFYISRLLGKDALSFMFGKRFENFLERANSKRGVIFICIIYLIPGLPNDLMCYVGGVSKLRFLPFLALSLIMRTPGMLGSIVAGDMLRSGSYTALVVLLAAVLVLTVLGIVYKEKLIDSVGRFYERLVA